MGTNRKLPFGYRMEFGRIAIHLEEANWVQHIFTQYNQGVSFQGITDKMRNSGMPYDGDKQWNKNMIAIEKERTDGLSPFGIHCTGCPPLGI